MSLTSFQRQLVRGLRPFSSDDIRRMLYGTVLNFNTSLIHCGHRALTRGIKSQYWCCADQGIEGNPAGKTPTKLISCHLASFDVGYQEKFSAMLAKRLVSGLLSARGCYHTIDIPRPFEPLPHLNITLWNGKRKSGVSSDSIKLREFVVPLRVCSIPVRYQTSTGIQGWAHIDIKDRQVMAQLHECLVNLNDSLSTYYTLPIKKH